MKQPLPKTHPFLTSTRGSSGPKVAHPQQEETTSKAPGLGFAATPATEATVLISIHPLPLEEEGQGGTRPAPLRFRNRKRPGLLRVFRNAAFSKETRVLMLRLTCQGMVHRLTDHLIPRVRNKINKNSTELSSLGQ